MKDTSISFRKRIDRIFANLKDERYDKNTSSLIPIFDRKKYIAYLRVASKSSLENPDEIKKMAKWREKHSWWFPAQFKVTTEGTKRWFENQVLKTGDRFLFMIDSPSGETIGHVGLYRFDYKNRSCEIDNIVRGEDILPGVMTHAVDTLIHWSKRTLKLRSLHLTVYQDNKRAIKLYRRVGFIQTHTVPLKKIVENGTTRWEEFETKGKAERYFVKMALRKGKNGPKKA